MIRIIFVVLLVLLGVAGVGVELYTHVTRPTAAEHGHLILYVGIGAWVAALALAQLGDDVAAGVKPIADLLRQFLPWGKKDPP